MDLRMRPSVRKESTSPSIWVGYIKSSPRWVGQLPRGLLSAFHYLGLSGAGQWLGPAYTLQELPVRYVSIYTRVQDRNDTANAQTARRR